MKNLFEFFNSMLPLSEDALNLMSEIFVPDELKKGDYFVKKGQVAKEIAFLETGAVRAYVGKMLKQEE